MIGPGERKNLAANLPAYQAHYRSVIRTPNYEIFAVGTGSSPPSAATGHDDPDTVDGPASNRYAAEPEYQPRPATVVHADRLN